MTRSTLPALILLIVAIFTTGCGQNPEAANAADEAEHIAHRILTQHFVQRENRWLALEGSKNPRLVELNKPTTSLLAASVSETDRMNGVQDRRTLTVDCAQFRHWNGAWGEWQAGGGTQTGIAHALVHSMTSGTLNRYAFRLEKKNGQWSFRDMKAAHLSTDRLQLEQTIAKAFGEIPKSNVPR